MVGATVDRSSSKSDLEGDLNHEESYPLSEDKEALKNFQKMKGANEQSLLQDIENFPLKQSSTFSSKSSDEESTPPDEKLGSSATGNEATKSSAEQANGSGAFPFPPVNGNRESSVIAVNQGSIAKSKGAIAIDIEPPVGNINEVPYIAVTAPSNEGEHHEPQVLISSQFFSYIYGICEGEGFDKTDFYQKIDLLRAKHRLYDVLLSQNEEGDTPLHVAIKKGKIGLTKEILRILDESYKLDSFYKDKYFEREETLFKVISTKNKEGKSVINLVIEGNDLEHIAAVFEFLPSDRETKQSLIECCGEVNDTREVLADNNKKSVRAKWFLSKGKLTFALLAGFSFLATVIQVIYNAANERTSLHRATIKHTSPYNYNTSSHNVEIEYASSPGFTGDDIFKLAFSFTGLMIFFNYVSGEMLSRYRKRDSILEERLKSCVEKRDKLISELESALKHKACTEELGRLREEVSYLQERASHSASTFTPAQQFESSSVHSNVFKRSRYTEQQPGPSGYKPLPKLSEKEGAKGIRSFLNQSTSLSDVDVTQGASTEKTKL